MPRRRPGVAVSETTVSIAGRQEPRRDTQRDERGSQGPSHLNPLPCRGLPKRASGRCGGWPDPASASELILRHLALRRRSLHPL